MGFVSRSCFESNGFIALIRTNEIEEKKAMFIHTYQPLITPFYIKKVPIFCRISADPQFSAQRAFEGHAIGRVRVNEKKFYIHFELDLQLSFR